MKSMPAANLRNASPSSAVVSPSAVAGLSEDLAHLNIPSGEVTVGSVVQCTLAQSNRVYKGEVMAFDSIIKAIILKCPSTCNRSSLNDVHIFNLTKLKDLKVIHQNKEAVLDPPSLNLQRLTNRQRDQLERKKRLVMGFRSGISPEGQKLFQAIAKTMDDITWHGKNIVVMKEVTITPPYQSDSVKGNQDSKALKHVRKIVEKHINDQLLLKQQEASVRGGSEELVSVNNNNNKGSESHALPGSSAQTQQSAPLRQAPTNRHDGAGGGSGRSQRAPGGARSSTQKREYEPSAKSQYTQ